MTQSSVVPVVIVRERMAASYRVSAIEILATRRRVLEWAREQVDEELCRYVKSDPRMLTFSGEAIRHSQRRDDHFDSVVLVSEWRPNPAWPVEIVGGPCDGLSYLIGQGSDSSVIDIPVEATRDGGFGAVSVARYHRAGILSHSERWAFEFIGMR